MDKGFSLVDLQGDLVVVRVTVLEEILPGLLAVFSTRRGGVSRPPWNDLNLSYHVGDNPADVTENRRRFLMALHVDPETLVTAGQVHGSNVVAVSGPGRHEATDGLVTMTGGLAPIVSCADCVPVFLADPETPAVGVIHAGWRGTLDGIAGVAVRTMVDRFGSRPESLHAAIGPSIGPCCYEVGPEIAAGAQDKLGPSVVRRGGGRLYLDLWDSNRLVLQAAGLAPSRVRVSSLCSFCREDLFHSHRRETVRGGETAFSGRMAAVVRLSGQAGEETQGPRKN